MASLAKQIQLHGRHSKSKAKTPCKCLRCGKASREKYDGKEMLICKDEACDMQCDKCTERPNNTCGFKAIPVSVEVCEGERMQA